MQLAYYIEDREGIITIEFSPSTSRNQELLPLDFLLVIHLQEIGIKNYKE